ncbi:MAG: Glycosyltransferase, group 1 family protein [Candidatus Amesbacteria bacterium GW2011_GWC1_48_10]|uniref:Glycosyltransferase, group 1 family protein n=2 Tax=Candidatus Amesiibacteriota TaxID=1752730 RepID=A0A0G1XFN7_9BACT|nr:MAG: Glycosyltransferase, group 1 family protein [Candidatus Amesbacteria bacterium GW2011_GWC1_48_10]OGD02756.1 MAG: hypothetical protein A2354_03855 [Candidatus Amesbacteria bacterium RIFOXYB1_FULL_47_12]
MKVLFMSRLYYPHIGGVEKHIEKISDILSKRHEITIVCEQHDPNLPEYEKKGRVKIYRIPLPDGVGEKAKKWWIWKWWLTNLRLIKQADIIHIHDVFFWFLPFRLPYRSKKVFITFHGYEGFNPPSVRKIFWHKLAEYLTRGNICIGDFHQKWYQVKPDFVSYGAA